MQVVRLGPPYSTTYDPDVLIEGYSSMIWTERFQEHGDFQLKTPRIAETLELLPADTLISHLETGEVMIVETRSIDVDSDGKDELTITGHSFSSFLEQRFVQGVYNKRRLMLGDKTGMAAIASLLFNAFDNGTGKDVTRDGNWDQTTLDRIANICITDSVVDGGVAPRGWWLRQGDLYPQVQHIMKYGDIGIRNIRPSGGSDGFIITITTWPLEDRGQVNRVFTENIQSLRFDLYNGKDRTEEQTENPPVVFSYSQGDLDKASYLFSKKDFKTVVELMTNVNINPTYRNPAAELLSGIKRRVMSLDVGEPEIPDPPVQPERPDDLKHDATEEERDAHDEAMDTWIDDMADWRDDLAVWKTKRDNIVARFRLESAEDAKTELKKASYISLFTGDISPLTQHEYNADYFLGDLVTLSGDYDKINNMVVTEYIRTEDNDGDRGYPTLSLPNGEDE